MEFSSNHVKSATPFLTTGVSSPVMASMSRRDIRRLFGDVDVSVSSIPYGDLFGVRSGLGLFFLYFSPPQTHRMLARELWKVGDVARLPPHRNRISDVRTVSDDQRVH